MQEQATTGPAAPEGKVTLGARLLEVVPIAEEGWAQLRGVLKYEVTDPLDSGGAKGTRTNVVVTRSEVRRDGLTRTGGNVKSCRLGEVPDSPPKPAFARRCGPICGVRLTDSCSEYLDMPSRQ